MNLIYFGFFFFTVNLPGLNAEISPTKMWGLKTNNKHFVGEIIKYKNTQINFEICKEQICYHYIFGKFFISRLTVGGSEVGAGC